MGTMGTGTAGARGSSNAAAATLAAASQHLFNQRWQLYKRNLFKKKITIHRLLLAYYVHIYVHTCNNTPKALQPERS